MHVKGPHMWTCQEQVKLEKKKKLAKATETNGLAEIANNLLSPLYERMQNEEYVWSRCWKWKIELDHYRYNMSEEVA